MTITFVSRFQGKVERGVENYVSELAPRLAKKHHVEVLTSAWQLVGRKPDVVYPLNGYFQSLGCRLYSWVIGAKLVLGGHAGTGRDDRWNLYMFPDLFITFSQKGFEWAKKVNSWIKVIKIPHGVDLEKFSPSVKPVNLDLERPIFITVSHLLPYKRVGETVKAVATLKKGSLLIIGEGPLEKEIDELGERLLGPKRYLRFKTSHNELPQYLRAADVFTLVSESSEAFGLVYLEALACNLPVVATDDSLRRELIADAGVFVKNPKNSRVYARDLETAVRTDWGYKQVEQAKKFDWERVATVYSREFGQTTGLA